METLFITTEFNKSKESINFFALFLIILENKKKRKKDTE